MRISVTVLVREPIVGSLYIANVPNRTSPPAILLRHSYRAGGPVNTRTLAHWSHWPPERLEALRQVLHGNPTVGPRLEEAFTLSRSAPTAMWPRGWARCVAWDWSVSSPRPQGGNGRWSWP